MFIYIYIYIYVYRYVSIYKYMHTYLICIELLPRRRPNHIVKWIWLERGLELCRGIGPHSFYPEVCVQKFNLELTFWAAYCSPELLGGIMVAAECRTASLGKQKSCVGLKKGCSGLLEWFWTVVLRPWTAKSSWLQRGSILADAPSFGNQRNSVRLQRRSDQGGQKNYQNLRTYD